MKLGTHDIVIVTGKNRNTVARLPAKNKKERKKEIMNKQKREDEQNRVETLPVPDANRLVVRSTYNPRVFVVEKHCADVVYMAIKGEKTAPLLPVPNSNLGIVSTGYKEGLSWMKIDTSDWACLFSRRNTRSENARDRIRSDIVLTVVLFKLVHLRSDLVVPKCN